MPIYSVSAMADRMNYLQNQAGMSQEEAKAKMQNEMGLGSEPLPSEVEELLNKYLNNNHDEKFSRNDSESIVNRKVVPNAFNLGQEQGTVQEASATQSVKMDSEDSDF
jgi:hypothetical protein